MSANHQDTGWPRATKIIATLGNVSSTPDMLRRLGDAGVNVFRLNFSHGTRDEQGARVDAIGRSKRKPECQLYFGRFAGPVLWPTAPLLRRVPSSPSRLIVTMAMPVK